MQHYCGRAAPGLARRTLARLALASGVLACLALAPTYAAKAAPGLTLGLIATGAPEDTKAAWQPLADALARALKVPVRLVASKNYADISRGLASGEIQVAWLNNLTAIELVENGKAAVFAQMVRLDGARGYKSLLLARKDGPVNSLQELLARPGTYSLAAGNKTSISGFLVPNYYIFSKHKIEPDQHFKSVSHASHRDNFNTLAQGKVDVAVNNTEEVPRYQSEQAADWARVNVIWESPLIPNDPILMRRDLSAATQKEVRRVFLGFGKGGEAERVALKKINGLSGFAASGNYQLRPVVDLNMFETMSRLMRETSKSPEQLRTGMDELSRRAAKLDTLMSASRYQGAPSAN